MYILFLPKSKPDATQLNSTQNINYKLAKSHVLFQKKSPPQDLFRRTLIITLREEIGRNKNLIDFKGHMCYKHGSPNEEKQFIIIILQ